MLISSLGLFPPPENEVGFYIIVFYNIGFWNWNLAFWHGLMASWPCELALEYGALAWRLGAVLWSIFGYWGYVLALWIGTLIRHCDVAWLVIHSGLKKRKKRQARWEQPIQKPNNLMAWRREHHIRSFSKRRATKGLASWSLLQHTCRSHHNMRKLKIQK